MKLQNNKGQFRLTIPKDIARLKGWKQGTQIELILDKNGDILIKEVVEHG